MLPNSILSLGNMWNALNFLHILHMLPNLTFPHVAEGFDSVRCFFLYVANPSRHRTSTLRLFSLYGRDAEKVACDHRGSHAPIHIEYQCNGRLLHPI